MVKVSLVIPVYNEIQFIQKTLESVIGEADEIVLSDNASTDGTSDICQSFANRYPEIKYTRQKENFGSGMNFNYCLEHANGKYIRLLGGHDLIWSGSTEKMLKKIESDDSAIMVFQKYCLFLNPDYSINMVHCYDDENKEKLLGSDNAYERVSAIPGSWIDTIVYSLHKSEEVKRNKSSYYFFTSNSPTDQGSAVILSKFGKILIEKETAGILMMKRPRYQKNIDETIEYLKKEANRVDKSFSNPFSYRFAIICEQYNVAKELELSGNAPDNFSQSILENTTNRLLGNFFNNNYFISKENLYISDDKDNIREEVYDKISEIQDMYKKKKYFNIVKFIKLVIKIFIPYGLIKLYRIIKKR